MSRAEARDVPRDPERASDFLAQARRFLADADLPRLTGGSHAELFERLQDEWRDQRGEVSYGALVPPAAAVDSQRADTRELVEIAAAHIKH
jgi:hypothetical protein